VSKLSISQQLFKSKDNRKQPSTEVMHLTPTAEQMQSLFEELEQNLPFTEGTDFSGMLSFTENRTEPIHRWYNFKEGYSHRLVRKVLERYPIPAQYPAVLDSFCGSGTTLVVAQSCDIPAVGVEINPFAALVSRIKTSWHQINPDVLEQVLEKVLSDSYSEGVALPDLTTFHQEKFFPNGSALELFRLFNVIKRRRGISSEIKNILQLDLAATIEDVSHLHKDGRLLRYRQREVMSPKEALEYRTKIIIEDLQLKSKKPTNNATVIQGDARKINSLLINKNISKKFGLILYSPPYLNNFDYSEVYKCELWLLGMINSYEQWRKLRQSTFRSHPSCKFRETQYLRSHPDLRDVWMLVEQAARCPDIGDQRVRRDAPNIIRGYFDDVLTMLQEQLIRLAPEGHIVCVVGNSKHGILHIPTDTLIAKIGKSLGLELVEIYVAKYRNCRKEKNSQLRESLVVFKKT
jgi:DNA modification methylase